MGVEQRVSDNIFKVMLEEYKKVVQIPFEEYKEQTKKDKKEVFQFMVHKMANDDIKLFESLEKKGEYIDLLEDEIERLNNIIKEVREYINKHCVNEKASKEMGFKCYTMADTNELEHIMKLLDKENNNEDN